MRRKFFGERWDAPVVDDAEQAPTPVGQFCIWCSEEIREGDRGFLQIAITALGPVNCCSHAECDLSDVAGHLAGFCRCTGYPSNRETARLVWRHYFNGRDMKRMFGE